MHFYILLSLNSTLTFFSTDLKQLKTDLLAIGVHPDDLELGCAGTIIKHVQMGQQVAILDLTRGELGTRGTPEKRLIEADNAAKTMGVPVRMNAGMADGFFRNDEAHQLRLITYLRYFRPDMVITNALADRHPDHPRAGRLVADACFYAGLRKIATTWEGEAQEPWRPKRVFHMLQDKFFEPTFIVDISDVYETKIAAIKCFTTQFYDPASNEPATYIAGENFLTNVQSRDRLMGKRIGTRYGEGFICENLPGISDLSKLILPEMP